MSDDSHQPTSGNFGPLLDVRQMWATGLMAESVLGDRGPDWRLRVWPAEIGVGTPLLWSAAGPIGWAYLGAQRPASVSPDVFSPQWMVRVFREPDLARQLTGTFALLAVNHDSGELLAIGDRLGVQAVHYARDEEGTWRCSTHLMWLLLTMGHDGAVNDSGFLAHMAHGYATSPRDCVYQGIRKLPPATALTLSEAGLKEVRYWSPLECGTVAGPPVVEDLTEALRSATGAGVANDRIVLGLTAGRDSLCLSSIVVPDSQPLTGTFGVAGCADQLQGDRLSRHLAWPHVAGAVCAVNEFPTWAFHVAFHSAGLATASYVDMAAFVGTHVPPGLSFVMGEGGESVREPWGDGEPQLQTLQRDYMTPAEYLCVTLRKFPGGERGDYPGWLLRKALTGMAGVDQLTLALHFFRSISIPGELSLRHDVLGALRPKLSPFLDTRFMEGAYGLRPEWFAGSKLHRTIIAKARPDLLPFFDAPACSSRTVQDWPARFAGSLGAVVYDLLDRALPYCDDVFEGNGVRALCQETAARPSRAVYHLYRVLSFALARRILRSEARERRATISSFELCADGAATPAGSSGNSSKFGFRPAVVGLSGLERIVACGDAFASGTAGSIGELLCRSLA
jgi:hypothetical protein